MKPRVLLQLPKAAAAAPRCDTPMLSPCPYLPMPVPAPQRSWTHPLPPRPPPTPPYAPLHRAVVAKNAWQVCAAAPAALGCRRRPVMASCAEAARAATPQPRRQRHGRRRPALSTAAACR